MSTSRGASHHPQPCAVLARLLLKTSMLLQGCSSLAVLAGLLSCNPLLMTSGGRENDLRGLTLAGHIANKCRCFNGHGAGQELAQMVQ